MLLGVGRSAGADLSGDAGRVRAAWQKAGATMVFSGTRFVFDDENISISLPETDPGRAGCARVALVGARGLSLRARFADAGDEPLGRASSHAGALELARCGRPVHKVIFTSEAGRGAVEVLVARADAPLPPIASVLPDRAAPVPAPPEAPLPVSLPEPERRIAAARKQAQSEGVTELSSSSAEVVEGRGQLLVHLAPGCHRVTLIATGAAAVAMGGRIDLDGELRDEEGILLARDRTDAPDVHMESCTGEGKDAVLSFVGAPQGSLVEAVLARFELPRTLPFLFGSEGRARMARALLARRALPPAGPAVAVAMGTTGGARVPIDLDPGACYIAVAGIVRGTPRGLGLRVVVGAQESSDERGSQDDGGAVAFCARGASSANLEVDARGGGIAWGLALYRAGRLAGAVGR